VEVSGAITAELVTFIYVGGIEIAMMSFVGTMVQLSMWPPKNLSSALRNVFVGVVIALMASQLLVEYAVSKGFNVPSYMAAFVVGWLGERIVRAAFRKVSKGK